MLKCGSHPAGGWYSCRGKKATKGLAQTRIPARARHSYVPVHQTPSWALRDVQGCTECRESAWMRRAANSHRAFGAIGSNRSSRTSPLKLQCSVRSNGATSKPWSVPDCSPAGEGWTEGRTDHYLKSVAICSAIVWSIEVCAHRPAYSVKRGGIGKPSAWSRSFLNTMPSAAKAP